MKKQLRFIAAALGAAAIVLHAPHAQAHEYYAKSFTIIHPWADQSAPGAKNAAVYMKFDEISARDKLVSASSSIAERIDVKGAGAKGIDIPAGAPIELKPGTWHLVLVNLKAPLVWGRSYPMTLVFEKSGPVAVMISIGED